MKNNLIAHLISMLIAMVQCTINKSSVELLLLSDLKKRLRRHFLESDDQGQSRRKKQFPHGLHAVHQPAASAIELE